MGAQGLLLALKITPSSACVWNQNGMPGIEPGQLSHKANVLPTPLLLWLLHSSVNPTTPNFEIYS